MSTEEKSSAPETSPRKTRRRSKLKHDLRQLEVDAYCALLSAFRAQGELTWKKESVLLDLRHMLRISDERHKMEMKRVREDENLFEIAQLSSSTQFLENDDEDEEIRTPTRGKRQKNAHNWGLAEEATDLLPALTAVPLPNASQPPNLAKISPFKQTSAASKAGKQGKKKGTPGRKRKAPASQTTSAKKGKAAPTTAATAPPAAKDQNGGAAPVPLKAEDLAALPNLPQDLAKLTETKDKQTLESLEASLKAEQERLRAELEQLQAELAEDEEDEEEEEGEPQDKMDTETQGGGAGGGAREATTATQPTAPAAGQSAAPVSAAQQPVAGAASST